jgi:uncharacterized membrane protein YphA (DoxX/SURF4 family)
MCGVLGVSTFPVPADSAGRMDLSALDQTLRSGTVGTFVVTAGTTGLGAVDPIHDVGTFWALIGGLVEFGGGIALVVGFLSRLAAIAPAADMIGAVVLTNWSHGFFTEKPGSGWEINLILFCMAISVVLTGPGRFAVDALIRTRLVARRPGAARLL